MSVNRPAEQPRIVPTVAEAGALLDRSAKVLSSIDHVHTRDAVLRREVISAYEELREMALREELSAMPLDRLRAVSSSRLRLDAFEHGGIRSVGAVLGSTVGRLSAIRGIGSISAQSALTAANEIADTTREHISVRIDSETAPLAAWRTVRALERCVALDDALSGDSNELVTLAEQLSAAIGPLRTLSSRARRLFAGTTRRAAASASAARTGELLDRAQSAGHLRVLDAVEAVVTDGTPSRRAVLDDFERRAARYLTLLELIVGKAPSADAAHGYLPDDDVGRIERQSLDTSLLRTNLRVYQDFGARFALQRRRAMLGDEMGTGKTLQAIAAMAHLAAAGNSHFLVICPATVLINWTREITTHSKLKPHLVHGDNKLGARRTWIDQGGVAVTTFETLRTLEVPSAIRVAMLVVDEAHLVKNPDRQRSIKVREWTHRVERVLFLTGTPLENRVDEFRNLVGYLQPDIARQVTGLHGASGANAFRRAVAPVYLRRNQEDVLSELPEQIRIDVWEELGLAERGEYRRAVLERDFARMRQVAYTAGDPRIGGKPRRLRELAQEACEDGRKVVVFSYFRNVLELVRGNLQELSAKSPTPISVFGVMNGSTAVAARQRLVDEFTAAPAPAVLITQIDVGGIGLNLQAASVVILCEPQLKPSTEEQAMARVQRMGQVRRVTMYRLLATDCVDERLLEILSEKEALFDIYARRSETADRYPDAKDVTEATLKEMLINGERHRVSSWTDSV